MFGTVDSFIAYFLLALVVAVAMGALWALVFLLLRDLAKRTYWTAANSAALLKWHRAGRPMWKQINGCFRMVPSAGTFLLEDVAREPDEGSKETASASATSFSFMYSDSLKKPEVFTGICDPSTIIKGDDSRTVLDALKRAEQFIVNGVDLGYIHMPGSSAPDAAHETLQAIQDAIARVEALS